MRMGIRMMTLNTAVLKVCCFYCFHIFMAFGRMLSCHRTVVGSEALGLGGERWLGALDVAVVPLVAQLAGALTARSRPDAGIERTLRAAVLLLCKALLQVRTALASRQVPIMFSSLVSSWKCAGRRARWH